MATTADLDVDALWERLARTVRGLQTADRLPGDDGHLYDPRLVVVRHALYAANPGRAKEQARALVRTNQAAAFLAYELLREYYLAAADLGRAAEAAREASKLLAACEKTETKRRRKRGY